MFSEKVYKIVKKIPSGKISTYKIIAEKLNSKAYRAVGSALNKNPYKDVPCHRIINSSGFIGQFSKGIDAKMRLLRSEGIKVNKGGKINLKKYLFKLK